MVKGAIAKANVEEKLKQIYGADFLGKEGNKIYVAENDGGAEKVQIAITMTCPKILFEGHQAEVDGSAVPQDTNISEKEEETLKMLLKRMNL